MPGRFRAALVALAPLLLPAALSAQADSVTVAPGAHYGAGGLKELFLGRGYRDLWTTPVRVAVLDPGRFAGGLTPLQRGGGKQTISLRLRGADGREYVFRSVDKDQSGGLPPDFRNTVVDRIAQDQVSKKHPTSALVAAPLTRSAGVLHAQPALFVMPDHPFLGEFRAEFAGMLGTLEERPEELEGGNGAATFAGAEKISGTENLFDDLEESSGDRVDSRAFLTARLVDFLIGDWDRHPDQWRWARFERGERDVWLPIPRDRDNAFSRYDGAMMQVVRPLSPNLVIFRPRYPDIFGLTLNGAPLDRRLLSDLPRTVFDSAALALQRRITDAAIDSALARVPPEYHALRGQELAASLRARRDRLPAVAREFYRLLSSEVDVRATDEAELADILRQEDGSVSVRLFRREGGSLSGEPYFQRLFLPGETREVRVYLQGGDDHAVVRGRAPHSVLVRVIGGGGDDVLADSSSGRTAFYDHRGDNRFVRGDETAVDTLPYDPGPDSAATQAGSEEGEAAPDPQRIANNVPERRDWGSDRRWFSPWVEWRSNLGPVLGGGPLRTRYGFRREPFARQLSVRALYAPFHHRVGVEADYQARYVGSRTRLELAGALTQLSVTRFHGFGNESPDSPDDEPFKIFETRFSLAPALVFGLGERTELSVGPVLRWIRPEVEAGSPADELRPFGTGKYRELGSEVALSYDTRDRASYPRSGVHLLAAASAFPGIWNAPGAYGGVEGRVVGYLPVPFPLETTLAVRGGGRRALGEFPVQQAAFVGGAASVRGFPRQRFAGEGALFAGAELRTFLTRFNFITRGDLGVIGLADAGRVFADDDPSDRWHTGFGGGVWVGTLGRSWTGSVVYAHGEEHSLYVGLGMPF